jgi:hypothetical protein
MSGNGRYRKKSPARCTRRVILKILFQRWAAIGIRIRISSCNGIGFSKDRQQFTSADFFNGIGTSAPS